MRHGLGECASFSGRATRSECWQFCLGAVLAFGALATILEVLPDGDASATLSSWLVPVLLAAYLGLILATVAVLVRRLHDTGRPGWWLFVMLLLGPIGAVLLVAFASRDSGPDNDYGPSPRAELRPAL
jgi:uncharacterized membrane protein YhaH (DUF805 family)